MLTSKYRVKLFRARYSSTSAAVTLTAHFYLIPRVPTVTTSTSHSLTWQRLPCPKHHRQRARYDLGRAYGWYVVDYRFLLSGLFSWALTSTDGRPLGFLLFRVLNIGSDSRFDTIRAHFFQFLGAASE